MADVDKLNRLVCELTAELEETRCTCPDGETRNRLHGRRRRNNSKCSGVAAAAAYEARRRAAMWGPVPLQLPARVLDGIRYLTAHADAGGPDDLEIDDSTAEGRAQWGAVQAAIAWIRKQPGA